MRWERSRSTAVSASCARVSESRYNETVSDLFGVSESLSLLRRAEAGEVDAAELADVDWRLEARLASALQLVGFSVQPETLLSALSGGQRTRLGLAAVVFANPDMLLLDEPTNNLDREGRDAVIDLLAGWRRGAIVVSHDRELLDKMDAIVELTSLGAGRYAGNWSAYHELKAHELNAAHHDLAVAEKHLGDIDRKIQLASERKSRKDSVGRRKGAKGDLPRIALGGRKDRSEVSGGDGARLAQDRRESAIKAVDEASERLEILQPFHVILPSTGLPVGKQVLALEGVTVGYAPGRPLISDLSFTMTGPERVAITGSNGSGKTTLLAVIAGALQPWRGAVRIMTTYALLDQDVSILDPSASIRDNFLRINPGASENACRAALARFMFRSDAALTPVSALSGGQFLRAGLACVLGGNSPPQLLILDEPTNHLDIDSIENIEAGLRAFDGALLVVSHDEAFLGAIDISRRLSLGSRCPG